MHKILFVTGNKNKLSEVKALLSEHVELIDLSSLDEDVDDLPENGDTLEKNAIEKAKYVYDNFGINCFAEDTGLEIDYLKGEPGVFSARYAGFSKNPDANMDLVLAKMEGVTNRAARFRTVIALILDGREFLFEGKCNGVISIQKSGTKGFGYDPIFIPEGYEVTFAELSKEEKNTISHRGKAIKKLVKFFDEDYTYF